MTQIKIIKKSLIKSCKLKIKHYLYIIRKTNTKTLSTMKKYPKHIVEFANKMIAKGSVQSFEAICEMQMKAEAKKVKSSKKSWKNRDEQKELIKDVIITASSSEEMYKKASMNQRGSSMRD
jgi:predicted nucleotidyltransferase